MLNVLCVCYPFQIPQVILELIPVAVVNMGQTLRVRYKSFGQQTVQEPCMGFALLGKPDTQVATSVQAGSNQAVLVPFVVALYLAKIGDGIVLFKRRYGPPNLRLYHTVPSSTMVFHSH